jgi:hypothetical protein
LGGPSTSLPNFSFLPHLEVGQLLWTNIQTFTFIGWAIPLSANRAPESCLAPL